MAVYILLLAKQYKIEITYITNYGSSYSKFTYTQSCFFMASLLSSNKADNT